MWPHGLNTSGLCVVLAAEVRRLAMSFTATSCAARRQNRCWYVSTSGDSKLWWKLFQSVKQNVPVVAEMTHFVWTVVVVLNCRVSWL